MRKKSIIVHISILMVVMLGIGFSITNFLACKILENQVAIAKGVAVAEIRKEIGPVVSSLSVVSMGIGIFVVVVLATLLHVMLR